MNEKRIVSNGVYDLLQVNKQKAKRLYNEGYEIHYIGNKANPSYGSCLKNHVGFFWGSFDAKTSISESFDNIENSILFYLPHEIGTYIKYYISCDDVK